MTDFAPPSVRHPVLDHTTRAFVDRHTCPRSAHGPDPEQARLGLARLQGEDDPLDEEATSTQWFALPGGPTGHVRVQVVRPADSVGKIPVVLFLHGLGWVLGDAGTHERLVRAFALGTDAAVVFVEYERAPEAQYPIAVEQCYAVAKWICERGGEIGLDGSRMAAVGDSAGGNLVAALTLLAKERGGVRLLQQVLLCPVTDSQASTLPRTRSSPTATSSAARPCAGSGTSTCPTCGSGARPPHHRCGHPWNSSPDSPGTGGHQRGRRGTRRG